MPTYPCGKCPHCLGGDYIHCQNQRDIAALAGRPGGISTYAEYVLKPDWLLVPIPDGISYEHAAMACCGLGPTFGAAERMEVGAFHTLLISGAGPVGLGGVINGAYRGARVIVAEPNEYRRELAADLGAEMTVDPTRQDATDRIRDFAGGGGVDRALDCSGVPGAQRLALDSLRGRGHFAFVGEGGDLTINTSLDMLRKGLTLHGVWHYNLSRTPQIMELIADCGDKLDRLITHRFELEDVEKAWQLQLTGRCGKVLLKS
jgi:threonine dehydrogenase-like Zn-dependent dehydrogenase